MGDMNASCKRITIVNLLVISLFNTITYGIYLNEFAVRIEGIRNVDRLAAKYGMKNLGRVGSLKDYYVFKATHIKKRSIKPSEVQLYRLLRDPNIKWAEQQVVKSRHKRAITFNDPYWSQQWYLNKGGKKGAKGAARIDMAVKGAWKSGYTGKGIVVTILDDGLERNHPDLVQNYDKYASYDINSGDSDPTPRYDDSNINRHGTLCAGEVAATANNSNCVVGVAYNAGIGGIRMLDGIITDHVEAASLGFNHTYIDIYSSSWGPKDDGRTVGGPGPLAKSALKEGITSGRNGKGNIFMWASGNGGMSGDSCSCDGYTNSLYTISIGSVSQHGLEPWYLEECSSTMAVTYSSGSGNEHKIFTTDLHHRCSKAHTGTSASVPLAAGLVALTLEANNNLTWRDVQHITMLSASMEPITFSDWIMNGAKRKVSLKYGYGLLNATTMVHLARKWITVPELHTCVKYGSTNKVLLYEHKPFEQEIFVTGCQGEANEVNYLENVHVTISLNYASRGKLSMHITSPSGTNCTLLPKRIYDVNSGSFDNWDFLCVHFWGENPTGTWKFSIVDKPYKSVNQSSKGTLTNWKITLYGTKTKPFYVSENDTTQKTTFKTQHQTTAGITGESTAPSDMDLTTTLTTTGSGAELSSTVTTVMMKGDNLNPKRRHTDIVVGVTLGIVSLAIIICFVVSLVIRRRRLRSCFYMTHHRRVQYLALI